MKHSIITAFALLVMVVVNAQQSQYISIAGFTTQAAMPMAKFSGLFKEVFHPGAEIGYGKIFKPKARHEWYAEVKLAYFYHRFVQHGLPLYINGGYRHKIYKQLSAEASVGAGYMHSIPATAKLKLNTEGDYINDKGIGRMQAMATVAIGLSYKLNNATANNLRIFMDYQQRVQFPFVKSYVPLLPYNSFIIGVSKTLRHH